jgi:sialic acid synthase SpsE
MTVIAEMCQNHNGDVGLLKEMVSRSIEAGAGIVKFQLIFANMLSKRERFESGETLQNGKQACIKRPYLTEFERLKRLEISMNDLADMADLCRSSGVTPMCTAFTIDSLDLVKQMGFDVVKIASYDCASTQMLCQANEKFSEIFVSTGSTFNSEIEEATRIVSPEKLRLLHCVTIYPTPLDLMNLRKIYELKKICNVVGFSDHSNTVDDGIKAAVAARFFGATFVERHFTVLGPKDSRDGIVSIGEKEVEELVELYSSPVGAVEIWLKKYFPEFQELYASLRLGLSEEEMLNRDYYRGRFVNKNSSGLKYHNHV